MSYRFLKHIPTGVVYMYAPPWIGHSDFEEVADATGLPLTDEQAEVISDAAMVGGDAAEALNEASDVAEAVVRVRKKKAVGLKVAAGESVEQAESEVDAEAVAAAEAEEALSADASRGLP